jgi:nitrogen regulatory protein P-II 1
MLKKIEAFIQPWNLDELAEQLLVDGVQGMSVTEIKGFGRERGFEDKEAGAPGYKLRPKLKVEMVVDAERVESIIAKIQQRLRTGRIGDGKIFVTPVEEAVRISTEEKGERAIA